MEAQKNIVLNKQKKLILRNIIKLGGKSAAADSQSALHLGGVLSSMISSGLKDEQKDAFQIWREVQGYTLY